MFVGWHGAQWATLWSHISEGCGYDSHCGSLWEVYMICLCFFKVTLLCFILLVTSPYFILFVTSTYFILLVTPLYFILQFTPLYFILLVIPPYFMLLVAVIYFMFLVTSQYFILLVTQLYYHSARHIVQVDCVSVLCVNVPCCDGLASHPGSPLPPVL